MIEINFTKHLENEKKTTLVVFKVKLKDIERSSKNQGIMFEFNIVDKL